MFASDFFYGLLAMKFGSSVSSSRIHRLGFRLFPLASTIQPTGDQNRMRSRTGKGFPLNSMDWMFQSVPCANSRTPVSISVQALPVEVESTNIIFMGEIIPQPRPRAA